MTTVQDDIVEVVAKLTPAQRNEVMILSGNWASRPLASRLIWLPPDILETAAPLRTGHERVRLTPLGLRVRDHLLSHPSGKD